MAHDRQPGYGYEYASRHFILLAAAAAATAALVRLRIRSDSNSVISPIATALAAAGASFDDVVKLTMGFPVLRQSTMM
jgi:hypothetical protein